MTQILLSIDGMSCGSCVGAVERAVRGLPGVRIENVGIGVAVVTYDPNVASPDAIYGAIRSAGYEPQAAA